MEIKLETSSLVPHYIPYNFVKQMRLMMSENDTIYSYR